MLRVLELLTGDSPRVRRIRVLLLVLAIALGGYKFAAVVHEHYPIHRWLFWLYAKYWVLCGFWSVSVYAFGHAVLKKLLGRVLPIREQIVLSFTVGVMSFFLLIVLAGVLHLYSGALFVLQPVVMLAVGALPTFKYLRRLARHIRPRMKRPMAAVPWWSWPLLAYGFLALVMIYANLLVPENIAYDARWYHLRLAEAYAVSGHLMRYPEGWFLSAYPHLASFLYLWPFLIPAAIFFDRVTLAVHLEFTLFLWLLAAVPVLVRRLVRIRGFRARHAWVAVFTFPGIFLYDSSLCTNADHIVAFWAVPIYLTLLRAWERLDWKWCLLLSLSMAGALCTKYTAAPLVVAPVLALGLRMAILGVQALRRKLPAGLAHNIWRGPGVGALTGLLLTTPHWLKNWVFYGSPLYPELYKYLRLHPWSAEAQARFVALHSFAWRPPRNMDGLKETLKAVYSFSFIPHDWDTMHKTVPVFGSLFTLTILCLPFLRKSKRVWGLYLSGNLAVFVWYWVQHEDRYLQGLLPWFASAVAAVLVLTWREGWAPRVAVTALVGMQIIWGGDVYFFPTHTMLYAAPIRFLGDHMSSGFRKDYAERLRIFQPQYDVGKELPKGAVLLAHEEHNHLGTRVVSVHDYPGEQAGIIYQNHRSPKDVWDLFVSCGITHIWWGVSKLQGSPADDFIFYDFVAHNCVEKKDVRGTNLCKLRATPPTDKPFGDTVAVYPCPGERYKSGLYHLRDLNAYPLATIPDDKFPQPFEPAVPDAQRDGQLERADWISLNISCHPPLDRTLTERFESLGNRGGHQMWVRRTTH